MYCLKWFLQAFLIIFLLRCLQEFLQELFFLVSPEISLENLQFFFFNFCRRYSRNSIRHHFSNCFWDFVYQTVTKLYEKFFFKFVQWYPLKFFWGFLEYILLRFLKKCIQGLVIHAEILGGGSEETHTGIPRGTTNGSPKGNAGYAKIILEERLVNFLDFFLQKAQKWTNSKRKL